jgi:Arc/MetJ family transcription regulator
MVKRLVDIEEGLLEEARQALGTSTIKETVTVALVQAVRSRQRRMQFDDKALERFASAAGDLGDDQVMGAAWR